MTLEETIVDVFAKRGNAAYLGEAVSQTEHALQAAHLARLGGAPESLVVAALLHDIGHILPGLGKDVAEHGVAARHEIVGEVWLARYFGPEVTEPVRLHVPAKRYLCRTDPTYLAGLSSASIRSLSLQGGPFDQREAMAFEQHRYFRAALRLRVWDDSAKVPELKVPGFAHYGAAIAAAAKRQII